MKHLILAALAVFSVSAYADMPSEPGNGNGNGPSNSIRVRCEFRGHGKADDCEAWARICINRPVSIENEERCQQSLRVSCNGMEIYDDGLAIGNFHHHVVLQGITSSEFPTPPAIHIRGEDHSNVEARLVTSMGSLEGRCRAKRDDVQ